MVRAPSNSMRVLRCFAALVEALAVSNVRQWGDQSHLCSVSEALKANATTTTSALHNSPAIKGHCMRWIKVATLVRSFMELDVHIDLPYLGTRLRWLFSTLVYGQQRDVSAVSHRQVWCQTSTHHVASIHTQTFQVFCFQAHNRTKTAKTASVDPSPRSQTSADAPAVLPCLSIHAT